MFHIVFNADEKYIPYAAVLMTSIIKNKNQKEDIGSFVGDEKQKRESE
ncbi:hypothetical protein [Helicobacter pullorum]